MTNSVKRIFARRSGSLKALTKALRTGPPFYPRLGDQLCAAPGTFDLRARRSRERVRADDERLAELAAGQPLDRFSLAHQAMREHRRRVDLAAVEDLTERLDVHGRVLDPVGILEALELRHAALQRHLAALETQLGLVASLVPLGATAGGLALAGGLSSADAPAAALRALGGPEMVELHSTSSTSTR